MGVVSVEFSSVMIVRQFLQWIRNAAPGERAEATSALARAYLHSDLSADDLAAAEGAMIMLLDDPSPLVRRALSEVFASAQKAPRVVVHALAADQPEVALPVLEHSPLLMEDDLVDLIATGTPQAQMAIAGRALLPCSLAAALAEVGAPEPVWRCWKIRTPILRRFRSTAWSNASAISRPSARL